MNIIFLCMGQMLDVYYDCYKILKEKKVLNNGGFYVSDFKHYNKFLKKNKNFISLQNLFEWNLTNLIGNGDWSCTGPPLPPPKKQLLL